MGERGIEIGRDIDISGLLWIDRFGWIRAKEMGRLLWPRCNHSVKYAERIFRKWDVKGYVIRRRLPQGAGSAYVLSAGGVRFLEQFGVSAKSGKDWGETDSSRSGAWSPPASWIHDLRTNSLLSLLCERGNEIMTELQIKRAAPGLKKIPDGLVKLRNGMVCWLEVERSIKTGRAMKELVDAIFDVSQRRSPIIGEWRPATEVLIAIYDKEVDTRGYAISHKKRLISAIGSGAESDVSVVFVRLELNGCGVEGFSAEKEIIKSDAVDLMLRRMDWKEQSGEVWCKIGSYLSVVTKCDDGQWNSEVFDATDSRLEWQRTTELEPRRIAESTWPTISAAKRSCASAVSRLIDF